jgi:hypothetical protein
VREVLIKVEFGSAYDHLVDNCEVKTLGTIKTDAPVETVYSLVETVALSDEFHNWDWNCVFKDTVFMLKEKGFNVEILNNPYELTVKISY